MASIGRPVRKINVVPQPKEAPAPPKERPATPAPAPKREKEPVPG